MKISQLVTKQCRVTFRNFFKMFCLLRIYELYFYHIYCSYIPKRPQNFEKLSSNAKQHLGIFFKFCGLLRIYELYFYRIKVHIFREGHKILDTLAINTEIKSFFTSFHFFKFHIRIDFYGAPLCALDFSIIEYHVPSALLPPLLR